MNDLLFYDIEVFKHNSMVVFKNLEGETVRVFSSSLDGLGEYVDKGLLTGQGFDGLESFITGKTLVGYNNYYYDDYILYAMTKPYLQPFIKDWNDSIIKKGSKANMKKIEVCETLDCFQQIDVSKPSLKKVEGNMGKSIVESTISFDLDRPLTPAENLETMKYCEYDVKTTVDIYKMRGDYYSSKDTVVGMIKNDSLKKMAYKWNTTSIIGEVLKHRNKTPARRLVPDHMLELVPYEVAEMWRELDHTIDFKFKKKKVTIQEFKNVIEFGWGGLHGAPKEFGEWEDVRLADVASMYPSILINFNGLGEKTAEYERMKKERVKIKHTNKQLSDAYKLVLNSTYGLLNNKYSQLNNPHLAYSICIYGQISLYILSQRLAAIGAEIININTDGVAYRYKGDLDQRIKEEWEREFHLDLETEYYKKWIQKDVNNYIAVEKDGSIKVKGGDVNKYHKNKFFANNDIRITHIALVDYLVYGKKVYETIIENLDKPILYQYILQPGGTYKGVVKNSEPDRILDTKINRVFASKHEGLELVKKRQDDGLVKFADAPTKMKLWNGNLEDMESFKEEIDLQWYVDLVEKNLKRWR